MPIIMVTAKGEEVDRSLVWRLALTITFQNRLTRVTAGPHSCGATSPGERTAGRASQEEAVIAFGKFKLNLGTRECSAKTSRCRSPAVSLRY